MFRTQSEDWTTHGLACERRRIFSELVTEKIRLRSQATHGLIPSMA